MSLAEGFYRLFKSCGRSHGIYRLQLGTKPDAKGKLEGQARTVHAPVTPALFRDHLDGVLGLGLTPVLEQGQATWGAVDFDVYPIDLALLSQRVALLCLPLIVVRSKSGGAHLYLFMSSPVSAKLIRTKLLDWSVALGAQQGVEIFPKQDEISEGNLGSWINLPYQAGDRSTRYAHNAEGIALTPEEFLARAAEIAVDPDALAGIYPVRPPAQTALSEGAHAPPSHERPLPPPEDPNDPLAAFRDGFSCMVPVLEAGVPHARNLFVFHLALFSKLKYNDDQTLARVKEWMRQHFSEQLPEREFRISVQSALKKDYLPRCKEPPINAHCRHGHCMNQSFGIGTAGLVSGKFGKTATQFTDLHLGELVKINAEPPIWQWTINGKTIEVTSMELLDQKVVCTRILDETSIVVSAMSGQKWRDFIAAKTEEARIVDTPEDATESGQILWWVQQFCTNKAVSKDFDELAAEKTVTKDGFTHFQATNLMFYLRSNKVEKATPRVLWSILERKFGATQGKDTIKGKVVRYWTIPAFPEQVEEFAVPVSQEQESPF